jgi:hypothetical protein
LGEALEEIFAGVPIGLGIYEKFVHFDVLRAKDKRWTG